MSDDSKMTLPSIGAVRLRQPTGYGAMVLLRAMQVKSLSQAVGDLMPLADIDPEADPAQAGLQLAKAFGQHIEQLLPVVSDIPAAIVVAFCEPESDDVVMDPDHGGIDFKWALATVSLVDAANVLKAAIESGIVGEMLVAVKNIWPSLAKLVL